MFKDLALTVLLLSIDTLIPDFLLHILYDFFHFSFSLRLCVSKTGSKTVTLTTISILNQNVHTLLPSTVFIFN